MVTVVITLLALGAILVGRASFGGWFNHVTLYAGTWGGMLLLHQLEFITYDPVTGETWLFIAAAFIAFAAGSLLPLVIGFSKRSSNPFSQGSPRVSRTSTHSEAALSGPILVVTVILGFCGLIGAYFSLELLIARFGSLQEALLWGNLIYTMRNRGIEMFTLPYFDSLALAGSFFGGVHLALRRKFNPLILLPIFSLILVSIAGMGRAKLLMSAILLLSGYFVFKSSIPAPELRKKRLRRILGITFAFALLVAGAELIRSNRGTTESFTGTTQQLAVTRGWALITPSIYLYFSSPHVVFSEYLKDGTERGFFGKHTFLPFWRLLDKFGADTKVDEFQVGYLIPMWSNTGTYLRELHSDFGPLGALLVPFLLGIACTGLYRITITSRNILAGAVLVHLYAIVGMSWLVMSSRLGYWFVSLVCSLAAATWIEFIRSPHSTTTPVGRKV